MNDKLICGGVVPPPIIYAVCFFAGLGVDAIWPLPLLNQTFQYAIGVPLIIAGVVLFIAALREFSRAKTAVTHHRPTTGIVASGPFAISRNPIYLSMTIVFLGAAIAVDSLMVALHVAPAIAAINTLVIPKEEAFLEKSFGDAYQQYKSAVRRWI